MGLFSFNKDSGEKNTGLTDEARASVIEQMIKHYNLAIEGFKIELKGENAKVWGVAKEQSVKEKIILAVGNVNGVATVDDYITVGKVVKDDKGNEEVELNQEVSEFYTVKKGDSLSKISKEFYGDPMKYKAIFEANTPMLKNPDLIYPGQVLRIPKL
jgi:nucleoid-associated protein YgaU